MLGEPEKGKKMVNVSVIIPVYNAEKFIGACLDSVIAQTEKEIEILCVDDGSTDNSLEILRNYEKQDPRIRVFTGKNEGAPSARNKGFRASRGSFVVFFDGDDKMEPEMLEILLSHQQKSGAQMVMGSHLGLSEDETRVLFRTMQKDGFYHLEDPRELTAAMQLNCVPDTKLWCAEALRKYGLEFTKELVIGQDVSFFLKFAAVGSTIETVSEVVCSRHVVSESITNQLNMEKFFRAGECIDDARAFGRERGALEEYFQELYNTRIWFYFVQFYKYHRFPDRKDRRKLMMEMGDLVLQTYEEGKPYTEVERSKQRVRAVKKEQSLRLIYLHPGILGVFQAVMKALRRK